MREVFELAALPPAQQLERVEHRLELLSALASYSEQFGRLFIHCFANRDTPRVARAAVRVLDYSIATLIVRPDDVFVPVQLLRKASERRGLLDFLVFHRLVNTHLICALASDTRVLEALPSGDWLGHATTFRVGQLLQAYPDKLFEIRELLPLGCDVDWAASRSALGGAFDGHQLSEVAIAELSVLFPDDPYLSPLLKEHRRSVTE
jgi:hypothetical protein